MAADSTDIRDMATGVDMATVMLADTRVASTLLTGSTVELGTTVAEDSTVVEAAASMVEAGSTAVAVDTGNLPSKVQTAGSVALPAVFIFVALRLWAGHPANSGGPRPLYLLSRFLLEWRVAQPLR